MKNKLLLIASCIFFLSSCSDMRYAGMQKVKQNPTKTVADNQGIKEKISSPEIQSIQSKTEEVISKNSEVNPIVINEGSSKNYAKTTSKKVDRLKETKTDKKEYNYSENPTQYSQKNSIDKTKTVKESKIEKGSWLWYVVVGIVFVLVGSIITGAVGNILWIVGVVLVVYGLLLFLEVL